MVSFIRAWHLPPILIAVTSPAWAQFSPEQEAAFDQGAGITGANLTTVITTSLFVLAVVGLAWVAMSAFRTWAGGRSSIGELGGLLIRALALLTLIGVLLR